MSWTQRVKHPSELFQKGDEVEVSTPSGDRYYEIKKIEFV